MLKQVWNCFVFGCMHTSVCKRQTDKQKEGGGGGRGGGKMRESTRKEERENEKERRGERNRKIILTCDKLLS